MPFEWNADKADDNLRKHGIDFRDAIAVFDGITIEQEDARFDYGETRVRAIGALGSTLITVVYTMRGDSCRCYFGQAGHQE